MLLKGYRAIIEFVEASVDIKFTAFWTASDVDTELALQLGACQSRGSFELRR